MSVRARTRAPKVPAAHPTVGGRPPLSMEALYAIGATRRVASPALPIPFSHRPTAPTAPWPYDVHDVACGGGGDGYGYYDGRNDGAFLAPVESPFMDDAKSLAKKAGYQMNVMRYAKLSWIKEGHPEHGVSFWAGDRIFGEFYKTKNDGAAPGGHKTVREIRIAPTKNPGFVCEVHLMEQGHTAADPLARLFLPVDAAHSIFGHAAGSPSAYLCYGYDTKLHAMCAEPGDKGLAKLQTTLANAINAAFKAAAKCPYKLFSPGTYDAAFKNSGKSVC